MLTLSIVEDMLSGPVTEDTIKEGLDYYTGYMKRLVAAILLMPDRVGFPEELDIVNASIRRLGGRTADMEDLNGMVAEVLRLFDNNGLWETGAELVGSWCFRVYQCNFGVENFAIKTDDVDIAIDIPYKGEKMDLGRLLKQLGFLERFHPNGVIYYEGGQLRVEFIVPERGRGDSDRVEIEDLGISAQPLRFLDILVSHPAETHLGGVGRVRVPSPAAFAIHKLLIAPRRKLKAKMQKDYIQVFYVLKMLLFGNRENGTGQLDTIMKDLLPGWLTALKASVVKMHTHVPLLEEGPARDIETAIIQRIDKCAGGL
ncbi:hypothetical protein MBAV_001967 [Candidatus Magnetobacterium bavaricum]|uniref:Nucleotidyltransferase-like domain-containing protein n=1 Tax=Candidatus Magnetobacterium bavaricum TaxID=29290 RepID=A0A0F3GV51_9BACT|nr:hypothetical protein MBAV_001967 [Candidatus Magnetobacterium bavaricum]